MSNISNGSNGSNGSTEDILILFYHEESKACQKIKELIPKDTKIQLVDISRVNNIPASIKSVPTLVINQKEILAGKKAFDYFSKSDEMEYISFSGKNSGFSSFANIDDNEANIESNSMFSSINMPDINSGVPEWTESDDSKKTIDIDRLQADRAELIPQIKKNN
jgi:hypothetical protein